MVAGFRRSFSLPVGPTLSPKHAARAQAPHKSFHVRSTSLPSRSHPIISQLEDDVKTLKAWHYDPHFGSPAWLCAGLAHLDLLHNSLDDLLHLPHAQESLRRASASSHRVSDDFLRLIDAFGTFRSSVVELRQHQMEARAALRRGDDARLSSRVRAQKRTEKELTKLAATVCECSATPRLLLDAGEGEMAGIVHELSSVTASASKAVFQGVAALSAAASSTAFATSSGLLSTIKRRLSSLDKKAPEEANKRQRALERMEALEECMEVLESRSERVFRSLLSTRVSLLNILSSSR